MDVGKIGRHEIMVSLKCERSPVRGEEAGGAHFVLPRDRVRPQDGGIVAEDNLSGGDAASGHQEPAIIALQTSSLRWESIRYLR